MLDDGNTSVSSHQYADRGTWRRAMNVLAWRALLGQAADAPAADASRIRVAGGQAELHIRQGAFHGFDVFAPEHEVSRAALAARLSLPLTSQKDHTCRRQRISVAQAVAVRAGRTRHTGRRAGQGRRPVRPRRRPAGGRSVHERANGQG